MMYAKWYSISARCSHFPTPPLQYASLPHSTHLVYRDFASSFNPSAPTDAADLRLISFSPIFQLAASKFNFGLEFSSQANGHKLHLGYYCCWLVALLPYSLTALLLTHPPPTVQFPNLFSLSFDVWFLPHFLSILCEKNTYYFVVVSRITMRLTFVEIYLTQLWVFNFKALQFTTRLFCEPDPLLRWVGTETARRRARKTRKSDDPLRGESRSAIRLVSLMPNAVIEEEPIYSSDLLNIFINLLLLIIIISFCDASSSSSFVFRISAFSRAIEPWTGHCRASLYSQISFHRTNNLPYVLSCCLWPIPPLVLHSFMFLLSCSLPENDESLPLRPLNLAHCIPSAFPINTLH